MAGNGPINTSPCFCSDEDLIIRMRGDYWSASGASDQLAYGTDGVFAVNSQWTMTSASVNFEAQGLQPQQVIQLSKGANGVGQAFAGSGKWYALDSVAGNSVTLRLVNQQLGIGQPPAPASGLTNVGFQCNTYQSLIEDSSWDLKSRLGIDDAIYYRSSQWVYAGVEDPWRDLRAACVLQTMVKAYSLENRSKDGDFWQKVNRFKQEYTDVLERVQVRWGPLGNSEEPSTVFSCKLSR